MCTDEDKDDEDHPGDNSGKDDRDPMVRKVGKDEEAELYKHYTIQTLHAPRQNEKATELYQMLCITEPTIDGRCKQMDVMCFLDLFPFGVSGMHHPREVPLQSRDPQSTISILISSSNSEQWYISQITIIRGMMVARYLDMVKNEEIEGDLTSFS